MQENPNLQFMALTTWWDLWKVRNNFIFKGVVINPRKFIGIIQNLYPYDSEGDFKKEPLFNSKVLGLPGGSSNYSSLIFMDTTINLKMEYLLFII